MNILNDATVKLFERYIKIIDANSTDDEILSRLKWMCTTGIDNVEHFPIDKTHRWIGFIQGCLVMKEFITIDGEREFTRPMFQKYYMDCGDEIPESLDFNDHKS